MRVIAPCFFLFLAASAQTRPVAGLIVDQAGHTIRTVAASPDAATAGRPAVSGFDAAWAAPDGASVLVANADALYLVRRLDGALPVWREFRPDSSPVSTAAWSADSSALGLLLSETRELEFWSGLPAEPRRTATLDLSSIGERIVSIAVAPGARFAFIATQGRGSGTLYLAEPGLQPRMLLPLGKAGDLQLAGGNLYIADRGRNEVLRLGGWEFNPQVSTLLTAGHGLADPVGFAFLPDQKKLLVASAASNQILVLDLRTNTLAPPVDLDQAPSRFERLGQGPLFLLNPPGPGSPPACVFDASSRRLLSLAFPPPPAD